MAVIMSKQIQTPHRTYPISDLSVGDSVYLDVDGVPTEFLVIHHGNPSTSMYDSSCNGTWLLAKNCVATSSYLDSFSQSSIYSLYPNCVIHSWLNTEFLSKLDPEVQNMIKIAKVPYVSDIDDAATYTYAKTSAGMPGKLFLLSNTEVGFYQEGNSYYRPTDGVKLSYFARSNTANSTRVANNTNGSPIAWWLRSPYPNGTTDFNGPGLYAHICSTSGADTQSGALSNTNTSNGVRPALILPSDTKVRDDDSLIGNASTTQATLTFAAIHPATSSTLNAGIKVNSTSYGNYSVLQMNKGTNVDITYSGSNASRYNYVIYLNDSQVASGYGTTSGSTIYSYTVNSNALIKLKLVTNLTIYIYD